MCIRDRLRPVFSKILRLLFSKLALTPHRSIYLGTYNPEMDKTKRESTIGKNNSKIEYHCFVVVVYK